VDYVYVLYMYVGTVRTIYLPWQGSFGRQCISGGGENIGQEMRLSGPVPFVRSIPNSQISRFAGAIRTYKAGHRSPIMNLKSDSTEKNKALLHHGQT
jgi:hypothetical protein